LVIASVADVLTVGDHGSTFAAGPLVCRAAQVVFDRVNRPDFLAAVRAKGAQLQARLAALPSPPIKEVRGSGLLLGVALDRPVKPLLQAARERGLLVISAGDDILRLCPPLIVSDEQIEEAVAVLAQAVEAVA
jgi:acetylornithine/succinyldiaminopimelate/putrescine aminotransferase